MSKAKRSTKGAGLTRRERELVRAFAEETAMASREVMEAVAREMLPAAIAEVAAAEGEPRSRHSRDHRGRFKPHG